METDCARLIQLKVRLRLPRELVRPKSAPTPIHAPRKLLTTQV